MNHLVTQLTRPLTAPVTSWAQSSQRQACRNAMVASTAISASRQERDEVREYVDTLIARRAGAASPTLPAARLG